MNDYYVRFVNIQGNSEILHFEKKEEALEFYIKLQECEIEIQSSNAL